MARISDVTTSSRDSSPDPLTLPSSPPGSHSPRKFKDPTRRRMPSPRKTRASATPSKSIFLDTPKAGDASPWRIKVTVEAEPKDGSLGKRVTRTTTVPLKDESVRRSGSPTKRAAANKETAEPKRRGRKRKGTPIREQRPQRQQPQPEPDPTTEEDDPRPAGTHSPSRRASGRLARLSSHHNSTRSKQLSVAREELDRALQSAIGFTTSRPGCDAPGDKTVSLNEDFSMISVDSLQTAKEASMAHIMQTIPEGDKSAASLSHKPSPPLKVQYPDITSKAAQAISSIPNEWDPMIWKPSQPATEKHTPHRNHEDDWQQERNSTSQRIHDANPENVIVVDDEVEEDEEMDDDGQDVEVGDDADIWQDEASRSIDGDGQSHVRSQRIHQKAEEEPTRSPQLADLFAGEVQRPLRSKIPRTWRRSSGMDFTYVDSPAHEAIVEQLETAPPERRHSTDGSGVLTPPSTDEDSQESEEVAEDYSEEDAESEFQPEAEATRVQDDMQPDEEYEEHNEEHERERSFSPLARDGGGSAVSDSDSSSASDGEDTGRFFTNNMPQVFNNPRPRRRPLRQKTMDLTELLNLDGAHSPVKTSIPAAAAKVDESSRMRHAEPSSHGKRSPVHMRPVIGRFESNQGNSTNEKTLSSPLRRSLLKSSKIQGSPLKRDQGKGFHHGYSQKDPVAPLPTAESSQVPVEEFGEQPKGDDQDGMQHEENGSYLYEESEEEQEHYEDEYEHEEEEEAVQPLRSYEERLNLESPQKVKVNFNDSNRSSHYLQSSDSSGMLTLVEKKTAPYNPTTQSQPGILSRLTNSFWSAVVKPIILPQPAPDPPFAQELRTQLRRRYGVASEEFPWTMYHIRILHRMLNSLTSNRSDSIIPRSGPLPEYLVKISNTWQVSITNYDWIFTRAHAYVVWSFFQILVPQHLIDAMERREVEWLGDKMSRKCREYYGDRHGSEPVWRPEVHGEAVSKWVDGMKGKIGMEFVVRALGTAVHSNDQLAKREGLPFEELQRLGRG